MDRFCCIGRIDGGGWDGLGIVVGHTFFLLASAYSHGTQESHYILLSAAHASRVRKYRVTGLLKCIFRFSGSGKAEQNLNQPTYWCQLFIDNQSSLLLSNGGGRTGFRNGDK